MELLRTLWHAFSSVGQQIFTTDWSIVCGGIVAFVLHKLVKASLNIILAILFVAIVIALGTHIGILPPLDKIFEGAKSLITH